MFTVSLVKVPHWHTTSLFFLFLDYFQRWCNRKQNSSNLSNLHIPQKYAKYCRSSKILEIISFTQNLFWKGRIFCLFFKYEKKAIFQTFCHLSKTFAASINYFTRHYGLLARVTVSTQSIWVKIVFLISFA